MKEITQEIRKKIFALYYRQSIMLVNRIQGSPLLIKVEPVFTNVDTLLVTLLSAITDEHAIEVAKILNVGLSSNINREDCFDFAGFAFYLTEVFETNNDHYISGDKLLRVIDFLRSKGYALPAYGYTVDELVNAGIFKFKTPTDEI